MAAAEAGGLNQQLNGRDTSLGRTFSGGATMSQSLLLDGSLFSASAHDSSLAREASAPSPAATGKILARLRKAEELVAAQREIDAANAQRWRAARLGRVPENAAPPDP
jgi:hypothetical protein